MPAYARQRAALLIDEEIADPDAPSSHDWVKAIVKDQSMQI
jgi:hypothetical protein